MNETDFKNIDITFRYETYLSSNKEEKIVKDYNIIKDGLFNHYDINGDDIRNINFYNFYDKKRDSDSNNDLSSTLINHKGEIKLPFTSNYITLENINYIVTNDTEKLTLDDILKEPNKYQDLLISRNFENIRIKFCNSLIKFETNKEKYKSFFGNDFNNQDDFNTFLDKYNYLDFFEKYKNNKTFFDNEIVSNNRYPIENILINDLNNNYKSKIDEIVSTNSIFSKFKDNNFENFFKITRDSSIYHLTAYFNKLKENFEDNLKKDTEEIRGDYNKIVKLNTPKVFKEILYKYGKYFVNENDYKTNNTPEKFFNFIRSDETLIKKIITYYNIYTILNDIYIIRDTIIYSKEKFSKEVNNNQYKKIKKIIPTKQLPHISFNSSTHLKCYFHVEFENINNNSIIRFNTNLINIEKQLINNSKSKKYINYGINLFDKNINKKDILINTNIDLNSFKYDFDTLLNKNIEIFKTKKPKTCKEIFFDNDLFNYVLNNYKKKIVI